MLGDAEVHIVVTSRDLARQILAEWQEHLKHRSVLSFPEFVRDLRADPERGPFSPNGYHFWHIQDLCDVVTRWGEGACWPQQILADRTGTRFGVVGDDREFALGRARVMVTGLERLNVDVVGDLADLVPAARIAPGHESVSSRHASGVNGAEFAPGDFGSGASVRRDRRGDSLASRVGS
jgi:hypothetical protein